MYSDRVKTKTGIRITIENCLNNVSGDFSTRGRQITRKSADDKWEHDLFEDDKPQISNQDGRFDREDLRLKLQKKRNGSQSGGRGGTLGVRDLREKLSGTVNPPRFKRESTAKTVLMKLLGETKSETRTASNRATKKKTQQADMSVDSFLESLGLEKYSTSFQVEEVDMTALMHMTDDDLKALLIPMGPRKKILLALGSKSG